MMPKFLEYFFGNELIKNEFKFQYRFTQIYAKC